MANGITRFNLPAQQPLINTYVPLPYKELVMSGAAQQQQLDKLEAARLELGEKEFKFLPQDYDTARSAQAELDESIEGVADLYGTNLGRAKAELSKLQRATKKRFSQFGDIGTMQANYQARQDFTERERERLKKGDITQEQFEKSLDFFDRSYKGIGEGERYNTYNTEDLAKFVNIEELADERAKGYHADMLKKGYAYTDGMYIREGAQGTEMVDENQVFQDIYGSFLNDPSVMNYYTQGIEHGYLDQAAVENSFRMAAKRGASKAGYVKEFTDASMKGDPNFQYLDKKKEEEKKEVTLHPTDNTHLEAIDNPIEAFTTNIAKRVEEINRLEGANAALESEMTSLLDEQGNVPAENALRYDELLREYNSNTRSLDQINEAQDLDKDIVSSAIVDVLGEDNYMGIEGPEDIHLIDDTHIIYKDKDKQLGYKNPVTGDFIDIDEITPQQAEQNGYENVYEYKQEPWQNFQELYPKVKDVLKNSAYTAKDYTAFSLIDADKETYAKEELSGLRENILDNPQSYDVRVWDDVNNRYKSVPTGNLGKFFDTSLLAKTSSLDKQIKNAESDEERDRLIEQKRILSTVEGKAAFAKGFELDRVLNDPNKSLEVKLPTGDKILVSPKGSAKQSHDRLMMNIMNKIATGSQDPEAQSVYLQYRYPNTYNKYKNVEERLGEHTAVNKTKVINAVEPEAMGVDPIDQQMQYLHVGKGRNPGEVYLWVSPSNKKSEFPEHGERYEAIPQTSLSNTVLQLLNNFSKYAK